MFGSITFHLHKENYLELIVQVIQRRGYIISQNLFQIFTVLRLGKHQAAPGYDTLREGSLYMSHHCKTWVKIDEFLAYTIFSLILRIL